MRINAFTILLSTAFALCTFNHAMASDGDIFGKAQQDKVIGNVADALENRYVLEHEGGKFAEKLRKAHQAGIWADITNKEAFVEALNTKLYEITRDKHVAVHSKRPKGGPQKKMVRVKPGDKSGKGMKKRMGMPAGKSVTAQVLTGNIGLLTINDLMSTVSGMHEAMAKLQDTDGLIIDVRQCPGGKGEIAYNLASYFMDEGKLLTRYLTRGEPPREQLSVELPVGNKRYQNKPVYLVTSNFTGSACEALTYALKYHNLVTVIGENTAGAGHGSNSGMTKVGYGLKAFIPNTRPQHPYHDGGFEKIGVPVDIYSTSAVADERAKQLILTQIMKQGKNQAQLANVLLESTSKINEILLQQAKDRRRYQELIGEYGEVALVFDQGVLKYRSTSGRMVPLEQTAKDEFTSAIKRMMVKLRIERNQNGDVVGISRPPMPGQKQWTRFAKL